MFCSMIVATGVHGQGSKLKIHWLLTQVNTEARLPSVAHLGHCQAPTTNSLCDLWPALPSSGLGSLNNAMRPRWLQNLLLPLLKLMDKMCRPSKPDCMGCVTLPHCPGTCPGLSVLSEAIIPFRDEIRPWENWLILRPQTTQIYTRKLLYEYAVARKLPSALQNVFSLD